jgi:hypothetical protein
MIELTNGIKVTDWLESSRYMKINASVIENNMYAINIEMTKGVGTSINANIIHNTIQSRKDALRELAKY